MKYSRLTYEILKLIIEGSFVFMGEIIEGGYLANKSPEFRQRYQYFKQLDQAKINKQVSGLKYLGLIEQIEDEYLLTQRGKIFFSKLENFYLDLPTGISWDGKFDILIFDISEQRSSERARLRRILVEAGFIYFQKSVYVYPHPTEKQMVIITKLFPSRQLVLLKRVISDEIAKTTMPIFKKKGIVK